MQHVQRLLGAAAALCLAAVPALGERTLLHAGRVIDGRADAPALRRTLVIEGGRITAIEDGFRAPAAGEKAIDLRAATVLPGLMDLHVHLTSESGPTTYLERFTLNDADFTLKGVVNARKTLLAGFTTVRDLGGKPSIVVGLRNAIARDMVPGPRIFAAGGIASTGGHGDPSNGLADAFAWQPSPEDGVVNSAADARTAVRQRYKQGADLIKITATGGVLSLATSGQNAQFTEDEIAAIVSTARDYGFHVAAHAHGTEGIKRAIRAGVATIEHGTFMDQEAFELMKRHGTIYVPTISAGRFVAEMAKVDGFFPEVVRKKAAEIGPVIQETFAAAYRAGVEIAFGTDCGVCPHGDNAREFQYMVEGGMPAMAAIRSATAVPAELLGIAAEVGTLEAGKQADVIAVRGDPLADITELQRVVFVMKRGQIHKQP